MTWPWALLELEPTKERRAIQRAYAARLKVTRPDEHPKEFQALHEAYEAALEIARSKQQLSNLQEPKNTGSEQWPEDDTASQIGEPATFVDGQDAPPESLGFLLVIQELLDGEAPFADLSRWDALFADHPLEDIAVRQAVSIEAFQILAEFAWENRARLSRRGRFRTVLLQFDERFNWGEQELELWQQFPGEQTDNLLKRLTYSAPRVSYARPEVETKADRWAAKGYFWFTIVVLALYVLSYL